MVWNLATDVERVTTWCKVCQKPTATKGRSTTNLFQHLKTESSGRNAPFLRGDQDRYNQQTLAKKQLTVVQSFTQGITDDKKGAQWRAITETVTLQIAKDVMPI